MLRPAWMLALRGLREHLSLQTSTKLLNNACRCPTAPGLTTSMALRISERFGSVSVGGGTPTGGAWQCASSANHQLMVSGRPHSMSVCTANKRR